MLHSPHFSYDLFSGTAMNDRLAAEIERVHSDKSIRTLDEANVKQGVILPILNALGWNPFNTNEVRPEYPVPGGNVDYALRLDAKNKVFLEAKRPSEDISKHQVQLLNYSFADGVPLAILTNGLDWWFYLPLRVGSWEERRFCNIDLRDGDISPKVELLTRYLSKVHIGSGEAITSAEMHLDIVLGFREVEQALPRAWEQLITGPDDILVELLDEKVEALCGQRAGQDRVTRFLADLPWHASESLVSHIQSKPSLPKRQTPAVRHKIIASFTGDRYTWEHRNYTFKKIASFTFKGEPCACRSWPGMLVALVEMIYQRHPEEFHQVIESSNHYFGRSQEGMANPNPVGNSGYYVGVGYNTNTIYNQRCRDLLRKFGYTQQDLVIETI